MLTVVYLLFSYGLFNDNISSSDYAASNGKMTTEQWIRKDTERSDGLIWGDILSLARRDLQKGTWSIITLQFGSNFAVWQCTLLLIFWPKY
jgi:hypothetical protein